MRTGSFFKIGWKKIKTKKPVRKPQESDPNDMDRQANQACRLSHTLYSLSISSVNILRARCREARERKRNFRCHEDHKGDE
jgi:hypothetical protein